MDDKNTEINEKAEQRKTSSGLNVESIEKMILESYKKIELAKDNEIILILGKSKVGKSTLGNYLLGSKLERKKIRGTAIAELAPGEIEYTKINHTTLPETQYILTFKDKQSTVFCDTSGFPDNSDLDRRVLESINLELVIKVAKKIRSIIFVIDYTAFSAGKMEDFVSITNVLRKIFKDPSTALSSIIFVFTKIDNSPDITEKNILDLIHSYLIDNKNLYNLLLRFDDDTGSVVNNEKTITQLEEIQSKLFILEKMQDFVENVEMVNVFDEGTSRDKILGKIRSIDNELHLNNEKCFNFTKYDTDKVKFKEVIYEIIYSIKRLHEERKRLTIYQEECKKNIRNLQNRDNKAKTEFNQKKDFFQQIANANNETKANTNVQFIKEQKENKKYIKELSDQLGELQKKIDDNERKLKKLNSDEKKKYWVDTINNKLSWFSFFNWSVKNFIYQGVKIKTIKFEEFKNLDDEKTRHFKYKETPQKFKKEVKTNNGYLTNFHFNNKEHTQDKQSTSDNTTDCFSLRYTTGYYKNAIARLTVFVCKKHLPKNEVKKKIILEDSKNIKQQYDEKKKTIETLNEAINILNEQELKLKKEYMHVKSSENRAEIVKDINSSGAENIDKIKAMQELLFGYTNTLNQIKTELDSKENFSEIILSICKILNINSHMLARYNTEIKTNVPADYTTKKEIQSSQESLESNMQLSEIVDKQESSLGLKH